MLNQIVLVGKVKSIEENQVVISVSRSFKNKDGVYESDIISITLTDVLYKQVEEYVTENDIIGIKGRVQNSDGEGHSIVAEKVTFLSSGKEK